MGLRAGSVIDFYVPGKPAPQGSKRHVGRGIMVESGREAGPWLERVALAAHNGMAGRNLLDGAVGVRLDFVLPRPKISAETVQPARCSTLRRRQGCPHVSRCHHFDGDRRRRANRGSARNQVTRRAR
jgi:hypothetical protein